MKKALRVPLSILLLALAVAVTQIPAEPVAADTVSESVDADFQMNGTILMKYTGTAKTVSVPASVTAIEAEAFADHTEMEKLLFKGNKVEYIAYRAFAGCTGLEEVRIPDTVTELGNGAFSNCTALETVTFGTALHKLGIGPFAGCPALEEIIIAKDNKAFAVDDGCLYSSDKSKLYLMLPKREKESYTMPSTVKDIAEYAFWGCNNVKSVGLSSNLKKIPDYAFSNCKSLIGVTIPYSVTGIGLKAFADCVNLETVVIPASVAVIHDTAFDGCSKLKITADSGTAADKFYEKWKEKNQAEHEDTVGVGEDVSGGDAGKTETEGPTGNVLGSTYVVGNRAVVFIDNTEGTVYGEDAANSYESTELFVDGALAKGTDIPKYTIAFDSILADQAFYRSREAADYQIPEGITEIGEFSFARSNLVKADIPDGVTTIGYGAFYHCDYLREVRIPKSVIYIAPKAFTETMWLKSWLAGTGGEEYLVVGNGILLAYRGAGGNLVLPDTVKRIAPEVFAKNSSITSVTLPDSLIEIGEDAFLDCTNLRTVYGGGNVKIIRDRAFQNCMLTTAHVWEKVEHLGLNSFDFEGTSASTSSKVVVFDSKEALPKPSYELTAERLSNEQARGLLLGDTQFVIVDKNIKADDLTGTVIAPQGCGFKGIIAYISSKDKATVACLATTYTEAELAEAYIPEYITIDGKSYQVTGVENITVFGRDWNFATGSILVENESAVLSGGGISAELEGNEGAYYLSITDSEDAYDALNAGYEAVYYQELPKGAVCVNISLIDKKTGVPITKMGAQTLRVTLTLPENIRGGSLRILTTDRNGQLENVSYTREEDAVTFTANHLSSFAFVNHASNVAPERLDDSPDTGDYLHPKWFLAGGLFCMAIVVLLMKKKRQ